MVTGSERWAVPTGAVPSPDTSDAANPIAERYVVHICRWRERAEKAETLVDELTKEIQDLTAALRRSTGIVQGMNATLDRLYRRP